MEKQSYESAISRLQNIVLTLEEGKLSLEDSLKLFEEGTEISKFCNDYLNKAENKIVTLSQVESINQSGKEKEKDESN